MTCLYQEQQSPRSAKLSELLSDNDGVVQAGESLYSPAPAEARPPVPQESDDDLSAKEMKERFPVISRFVSELNTDRIDIPEDELKAQRESEFEQAIVSTGDVYTRMVEIQKRIDSKRGSFEDKILQIRNDSSKSPEIRAAKIITLEMREQLNEMHDKFLDIMRDDMLHIISYVKAFHEEQPLRGFKIKILELLDFMNEFPWSYHPAAKLKRQELTMKAHVKMMIEESKKETGIDKRLSAIFLRCEQRIDDELGYFPDHGIEERFFEMAIEQMNPEFGKRMNVRIFKCIADPTKIGAMILDQCTDLAQAKKFDLDKTVRYMFLFFARLYFSRIYEKSLATQGISPGVYEFQRRVYELRKVPPVGFGFGEKFLVTKLKTLPLNGFPSEHCYTEAMGLFQQLAFQVCPIDFSRMGHNALAEVQKQARRLVFENYQKETGQIVAESDYSLSLDELFDITFIVFLLSDPVDTWTLVQSFRGYIKSLQLPSPFAFAFTNISAMCDRIMSLNMDEFMKEVKVRLDQDQNVDPLNIAQ